MTFEWPSVASADPAPLHVNGSLYTPAVRDADEDEGLAPADKTICFVAGTQIATTRGARAVEDLAVGDLVLTRDHGLQPIRWVGQQTVAGDGALAPVRFAEGSLPGLERELSVSPRHRMLLRSPRAELYFGESEVLVRAQDFIGARGVASAPCAEVTYVHILFDQHEIIYAEGTASESFHPADAAVAALAAPARERLFTLMPHLRSASPTGGRMARRCLRRHEALTLLSSVGSHASQFR